jgi:hypothetical protein
MGKRGKASRKRQRENNDVSPSIIASKILKKHASEPVTEQCPNNDEDGGMHGISVDALSTTISTLQRLCEPSDVSDKPAIKDKRYRSLRRVLYDVQKSLGTQSNAKSVGRGTRNLISFPKITSDITEQIEHGAWDKAIATLRNLERVQELQRLIHQTNGGEDAADSIILNQYRPKLGALQRWVREIDAAGTDDPLAIEILDAMLRVVAPESLVTVDKADLARASWATLGAGMGSDEKLTGDLQRGRIRLFPAFCTKVVQDVFKNDKLNPVDEIERPIDLFDKLVSSMTCDEDGIRRSLDSSIKREDVFRVCGHEVGKDRKPPNKYDLDLLTTSLINEQHLLNSNEDFKTISSCNILVERDANINRISKTPIPYVHGTFLLENVLSPTECDRLIAAAEMAGYRPDEPLAGQPGASTLAHACVWIVDHQVERTIFARVQEFLPIYKEQESDEVFEPLGVNRRFRFYRYVPGRYYRPHIDGAWPSSGFDNSGEYRYDINDIANKNGMQFIQPEAKTSGSMPIENGATTCAHTTRPQLSRLTFLIYLNDDFDGGNTTFFIPASEAEGVLNAFPVKPSRGCVLVFPHGTCSAPLHEGSPVLNRCKYVVRTEVEYYV